MFERLLRGRNDSIFDTRINSNDYVHPPPRSYITLLKVDVEHAEKIAIPAMLNRLNNAGAKGLPFKQLLMEIHHSDRYGHHERRTPHFPAEVYMSTAAISACQRQLITIHAHISLCSCSQ